MLPLFKPASLKSSSFNRGHHLSLQVPLALLTKKVGPESGLETSNANDTVDKSPKVYTQLARESVVLTQDSGNI